MNSNSQLPFVSLVIDSQSRPSSSGATFEVKNPLSNQVVAISASASSADCQDAIEAAAKAFVGWESASYFTRRDVMLRAADLLAQDKYKKKIIQLIRDESGAHEAWGTTQWTTSQGWLRTTAGMVNTMIGETIPSITGGHVMVQRKAKGVILAIAPWNSSFSLSIRAVALPIVCGNTVVLKPSEYSPGSQALVVELFQEAGLPNGVLNYIPMSRESSPKLTAEVIANPHIRALDFTGSDRVGRILAAEAAKYLKPCVFELGGKSPAIILDDANVEDAAKAIVYGAMVHSGQVCMSSERIIVQRGISESLIAAVTKLSTSLKAGDPLAKDARLPPLINEGAAENVLDLIKDAVDQGAELLLGDISRSGSVIQPHLLKGVKRGMKIWERESFGPVTGFAIFDDIEEAIELVNDSDYTLNSSLWTTNVHSAMKIGPRIHAGSVQINGPTFHSEPLMGVFGIGGASGYGRFDVEHFTDKHTIVFHPPGEKYGLVEGL